MSYSTSVHDSNGGDKLKFSPAPKIAPYFPYTTGIQRLVYFRIINPANYVYPCMGAHKKWGQEFAIKLVTRYKATCWRTGHRGIDNLRTYYYSLLNQEDVERLV